MTKKGGEDFNADLIANKIAVRLFAVYENYKIDPVPNQENYELHIKFNTPIKTKEDIDSLISLIDYTLLLFLAINKS